MAIKPKKVISSRGEGGVGGARGGGTGGSVKVMPGTSKPRADYLNAIRDSANKNQREKAANPSILDKVKKGKTVKISSAPAKSPDAARAANAKALKAANKKKK